MNRADKIPSCTYCKTHYQIGEANGYKNPMLLVCGHDMCINCIKHLFKKHKQVICRVCQADSMIKCDDEISNIPIHYFIVGKVWYSLHNKKRKIYQDISNITMKKVPSKSLIKTRENCQTCQKYAAFFCEQCDEVYCEDCSQEFHMEDRIMLQHDLYKLDTTHLDIFQASKCDLHLKINDFICVTCEIELCPVCAVENHRHHEVHHLEKYNISQSQRLNEYSLKGDILLKRLKHYRDKFNEKVQKHQCSNFNKNKNNEQNKKSISTYVSSVIGALQCLEQRLFRMIDQAEQSSTNSMTHVVGQLSSFIDDLQRKLNILDVLLKNNNYSSKAMVDHIAGIERMLDTTYYLAKKSKSKSSILFDQNIYAAIQHSVCYDIDTSDRYVLGCSPDLLPEYILSATIGLNSDENALSKRRLSSVSSILSSTISISSNYSAVSGEAASTSGDVSTSSADAAASSADAAASSADVAAAGSYDDNTPGDSAAASVVYGLPQSKFVKEIVKNEVELVVVSHLNSPSDFYVQLNANSEVFDLVERELEIHVKSKRGAVPVGHVEIDNTIMYAIQRSTNEWCRGVVLHTFNDNNTDLFRVHFIDYGFMETLTVDRIRSAPVSVVSIPPLAYNCAIYDLKPKYTTGWSNEAYILFNDLMSAKIGSYLIYPLEIKNLRIEVDVVWNGDINYPLSIRDAMFFLGYGSYEYYVNKKLHQQLVNMLTLPDNLKLEEEKRYSVILCHFISPTEFYMRISDDTAQLEEVMNTLKTIYIPTAENTHKSYLLYTPQIGMAVAARYSIDGNWHRAKIMSLPEERLVTVFYIDFGNSETLPWDELRVLDKNLIKTPPLAIKASLADVNPAADGIESTKWSDIACAAFLNFSKIDYADDNLIAFVHKVDGDTHKIVLYNRSARAEICLNSKLVSQGYATTMDPISCIFKKTNIRKQVKKPVLLNSRNKEVILPCDDTLSFTKLRSVTENENHDWKNKKNKLPGMPMSIVKVVSPDEIILKKMDYNAEILTEKMNKVYSDKKKKKTLCWKINDLCAILIKKYGNWYRGKIININVIKQMVTVYFYDLNETIDEIPIKTLHVLEEECGKLKCGILHCCLSNLVPLGASDGVWPKYSCDRLIEELKKYPTVYFSNHGKENDIAIGELWVRVIEIPRALEPIREHWTNINRFMIEQGFALSKKQDKMDGEYSTSSQTESEFNYSSVPKENDTFINSWMPPIRLVKSQFNTIVTNVDLECNVYFQMLDDDTIQSLQLIMDELKYIFSNSQPEPINMKWSEGQSVIVKYHLDDGWYRGTILKVGEKGEFTVQYCDYGNIDTCMHNDLRSTLYMTEVPQLCHRGFFSSILPITKNGKWPIPSLDHIHNLIVDKKCRITIDENLSTDDNYAIKFLRRVEDNFDLFQFLVTEKKAYFEYVSSSLIDLVDTDEINDGDAADDSKCDAADDNGRDDCTTTYVDGGSIWDSGERRQPHCDGGQNYASEDGAPAVISDQDDGEESGYSKFCLERNEVVEGTMCRITGPTSLTLAISKIGGVDVSVAKNNMHKAMSDKCSTFPPLNHIIPGAAVIVHHNALWRRGVVEDCGNSVFLVDFGISVNLVKKDLRRCVAEFFELPMFTIDCRLENVRPSDDAGAEDVVDKLSKALKGVSLKIVGISESDDDDIVGVELYNGQEEIAYRSLIDAKLLIPAE